MRYLFFLSIGLLFIITSCDKNSSGSESSSLLDSEESVKLMYCYISTNKSIEYELKSIINSLKNYNAQLTSENWTNKKELNAVCEIKILLPSSKFRPFLNHLENNFNIKDISIESFVPKKSNNDDMLYVEKEIVFSELNIKISKEINIKDSFLIGLEKGKDSLKSSIQGIVPFFVYVIPYLVVFYIIYIIFRFITRRIFK